ncbi:reverse transcriptase domain, reverse transcriptase zinc-binding domain protein [Tanacetum coccineum]
MLSFDKYAMPTDWSLKYLNIISLPVPLLQPNDRDCIEWRDDTGMVKPFSVAVVWGCIRPRNTVVPWFNVVCFSEAIPRHTFLMWLVIKGKLNTQDKMVWSRIKVLAGLSTSSSSISDVVDQIFPISKRGQVIECIKSSVRLKLLSCSFKMSKAAKDMLTLRQLPETIICTSR